MAFKSSSLFLLALVAFCLASVASAAAHPHHQFPQLRFAKRQFSNSSTPTTPTTTSPSTIPTGDNSFQPGDGNVTYGDDGITFTPSTGEATVIGTQPVPADIPVGAMVSMSGDVTIEGFTENQPAGAEKRDLKKRQSACVLTVLANGGIVASVPLVGGVGTTISFATSPFENTGSGVTFSQACPDGGPLPIIRISNLSFTIVSTGPGSTTPGGGATITVPTTVTDPGVTVTAPGQTVTAPGVTVTATPPGSTVTVPASTIYAPQGTVTVSVPGNTVTVTANPDGNLAGPVQTITVTLSPGGGSGGSGGGSGGANPPADGTVTVILGPGGSTIVPPPNSWPGLPTATLTVC